MLVASLAFVAILALMFIEYRPESSFPSTLAVGSVSTQDVEAPRTLEMVNGRATEDARKKAYSAVNTVFTYDPNLRGMVVGSIEQTFGLIGQAQALKKPSDLARREDLLAHLPVSLSPASSKALLGVPGTVMQGELKPIVRQAVEREMAEKIEEPRLEAARDRVAGHIRDARLPTLAQLPQDRLRAALVEIARNALTANFVENVAATRRARQEAMAAVEPVKTLINRRQMIIRKGDVVTPEHLEILEAFGLQKHSTNLVSLLAGVLFTSLGIFIVSMYLDQQASILLVETRLMWLLALLFVAGIATARACLTISPYLAPVITSILLIAILLDYRLGLMATPLLSLCVGVMTQQFAPAAVVTLTGIVAVLSVRNVTRRSDLIVASVVVCLVNTLAVLIFGLYANDDYVVLSKNLLFGALNGSASSVLAVGALPFLETVFGVTTHIRLLELSNPSEPLLQRLMVEAPGTYHHSIIVANLAEGAAREIGADSLLAKVGAFYHDIGKMKAATFFVENQLGQENPHDRLTPTLSAHIIISHVKDGMEMARQSRLPQIIADFIDMHHGDRLVSFFYHKALQRGEEAKESDYRYHGRRPRSKETAIVMMADTIEAKARLLARPNQENLETMVRESIKNIMNDGQLDESELSLRDLQTISRAFVKSLMGMYHSRIEYPSFPGLPTTDEGASQAKEPVRGAGEAEDPSPQAPSGEPAPPGPGSAGATC